MPRKNLSGRDLLGPHHVYNRTKEGRVAFRSNADCDTFIAILESRLSRSKFRPKEYRKAATILEADVSSLCLVVNHFHMIVWQHAPDAMSRLIQSVLIAYTRHYNRKYNQQGPLFDGPFRSRPITDNKDLRWTTAYVHANHPSGLDYRYSTHRSFIDDHQRPPWIDTDKTLQVFGGRDGYKAFMRDRATRAELNRRFFGEP